MISRRTFFLGSTAVAGAFALGPLRTAFGQGDENAEPDLFEVMHTDEEWQEILAPRLPGDPEDGPSAYAVLRRAATEYPNSHAYTFLFQEGMYHCRGCDLPNYAAEHKYWHSGWPSFWAAQENAVIMREDLSLGMVRTELLCRRCGGHLGHIFDDGPPPTGKRHCINGLSLRFYPA